MRQEEWLRSRSFPGASHLSSTQLKNSSHVANVKKAAKDGYTRISGESSFSKFARTNSIRAPKASRMPMTPQRIQEGKNDPRTFKEGASFISGDLPVKQIAGLVGQSGHGRQQLRARDDVSGPRIRQGTLRGDDVDLVAQTVLVRVLRGGVRHRGHVQQCRRGLLLAERCSCVRVRRPHLVFDLVPERLNRRLSLLLVGSR